MGASTQFPYDCPHCGTRKAGFIFDYVKRSRGLAAYLHGLATCGVCDSPVAISYIDKLSRSKPHASLAEQQMDFPGSRFTIVDTFPKDGVDVPERLPDNIGEFFRQGITNEKAENWDAAGAMFRKSLDVATKILSPDLAKLALFGRIEALRANGRLTSALAEWSHEVRIDGNEAVHSDQPETESDVKALHEFCRAILLYTFTFPALVQARASLKQKASS